MNSLSLPDVDLFAGLMVISLSLIIAWDARAIWHSTQEIPELGELTNGGFAWLSQGPHEVIRQWGNLLSMAAMMVLPWALVGVSATHWGWVLVWDILLGLHLVSLLVPKRYAITQTHLFADGQRYEWNRLHLPIKQPKNRIILQRKGWSIFAPLPLGGDRSDLKSALERIKTILNEEE